MQIHKGQNLCTAVLWSLALAGGAAPCLAQTAPVIPPPAALVRPPATRPSSEDVRDKVLQGRAQMDENDSRAVATLREAALASLASLATVTETDPLKAEEDSLAGDVITVGTLQSAAEAHLYWGLAADRFAQRDESITALGRALRLSRANPARDATSTLLRRDANFELGRVLRQGLPLVAPDDVLDAIARYAHGGLWKPLRVGFEPRGLLQDPSGTPAADQHFLITDGKVFPPAADSPGGANRLSRVPPVYSNVAVEKLPLSIQMDKVLIGYAREIDGPNRGQWRQAVRVFYASPFLTKDRRDDMPRARTLGIEFLKVHALVRNMLGLSNLYARGDRIGGVSSLWLLEVSALWPNDEDDPAILSLLGAKMPNPNVGVTTRPSEPEVTALMRPWNSALAGQPETAPGEILFWKSGMARSEAEWLREVAHEYGHVALPPIGGFRPPLEPYGNGVMGETLVMLWAAANPGQFLHSPPASSDTPPAMVAGTTAAPLPVSTTNSGDLIAGINEHLHRHALPALAYFRAAGPNSPVKTAGTAETLRYLQGFAVYTERVYGARLLGKALQPLAARAAAVPDPMTRRQLMDTPAAMDAVANALRDPWGNQKTLRIWLPGAMNQDLTADTLVRRGTGRLKAGTITYVWLYVPPGTEFLRIEGNGAGALKAVGLPFTAGTREVKVFFAGKSGWQQFSLNAGAEVQIEAAQLEKK